MTKTKLMITGDGGTKYVVLEPQGTFLGRGANCDVILDDASISRRHAGISQDPFGRWIVEDLGSHNGVFIEGQRIKKAHTVLPGEKITISNFTLSISPDSEQQIAPGSALRSSIPVVDKGLTEDIVAYREYQATALSPTLMHNLNELSGRLLKLSSPAELYPQACLCLAQWLDTLVAVVRLACGDAAAAKSPEILACHFGAGKAGAAVLQNTYLHLSKRVLNAARSTHVPVMASSKPSSDGNMMLTLVDEYKPHVVFAARVNNLGETVDVLYVDILQDKSPDAMFDFVEAAARNINLAQKNLFLMELQKKAQALVEANSQLREKDRIKDEYVSRVTHDIKGHLAAIHSCLFIVADKSAARLSEKQADFLNRAINRTNQVTDFLRELLNLTRMRLSGRMEMEAFYLPETIEKAVETVSQRAQDKSIGLTYNIAQSVEQVLGNEFSINEMLTNLLFNAIKYTPHGKSVHLEASTCDEYIQLDFVDTGIGIPADEIGEVFGEFFRASNARKSEKDGTGLGLSLVKQIVERHEGTISVRSEEGKGSTFTVRLPQYNPS